MITRTTCLVCGGAEFIAACRCIDHLVSHDEFTVMKCKSCGFMFTQNIPRPEDIGRYYESSEYISHTGGHKSITDRLYSVARKVMLGRKASIIRKFSRKRRGSILDIGAGTGHFVCRMRDSGWEAVGVEVNETAREQALIINNVTLFRSLKESAFPAETFDAVTLWHVLEHIHNPDEYLSSIADAVKPDGILVIALPNPLSADAVHYAEDWAAFDVPRHLWHFDSKSIDALALRAGFAPVAVKRMPVDGFYISILSEKNRKSTLPLVRGLFKGFLFLLATIFRKQRASSLMYIYKLNS